MNAFEFILYVADQQRSKKFYADVLQLQPSLDVPGMTEFTLADNLKLGLMPENGIAKIITPATQHPSSGNGVPRCELYLHVDDVNAAMERAQKAGAKEVNPAADRDWGDCVGYVADPDGHIIAFAQKL
jgi:uncharacterized glyoxalase superfamily protein PhnB